MTLEEYEEVIQLSHLESLIFLSQVLSQDDNYTYQRGSNYYKMKGYEATLESIPTESNGELSTIIDYNLCSDFPYARLTIVQAGESKNINDLKSIRDEIQKTLVIQE